MMEMISFKSILLAFLLMSCGKRENEADNVTPDQPPAGTTEIASRLTSPWGLTFLPDGSALVSSRTNAQIHRIAPGNNAVSLVGSVPGVRVSAEGGLLGLAASPDFANDRTIYAYLSATPSNRVVAIRIAEDFRSLSVGRVLIQGITNADRHHGGRLKIGPDGNLWISTGDAFNPSLAPDRNSLNGKILRIRLDGTIPESNPFGTAVYSTGHRNVQGLAFGPDGTLYASELGHRTQDEVNMIVSGGDYGWPQTEGNSGNTGIRPLFVFHPDDCSPAGMAYLDGNIYMGALGGQRLYQLPVHDGRTNGQPIQHLLRTYGRIRTVEVAPDGAVWIISSNTDLATWGGTPPRAGDDRILRLEL